MSAEEVRLDKLLMQRGFASSRQRATELIKNGSVLVNSKVITKPGQKFPPEISIELTAREMPWVSRGALKLEAALDHWQINPSGLICLDVGASTGGFTELLLSRGAKKVYAVDTGTNQLAEKLLKDERVVNLEKTDIRKMDFGKHDKINLIVIDVSFISLELIFPTLEKFAHTGQRILSLIKPQFEVGRENVGKGGIVKKAALRNEVISKFKSLSQTLGLNWIDHIQSPVKGSDGNIEFLAFLEVEKRQ